MLGHVRTALKHLCSAPKLCWSAEWSRSVFVGRGNERKVTHHLFIGRSFVVRHLWTSFMPYDADSAQEEQRQDSAFRPDISLHATPSCASNILPDSPHNGNAKPAHIASLYPTS